MVKLGGSLLNLDNLVDRLIAVVGELELPVVIVGGGPTADLVRHWDEHGLLRPSEAHQIAVAAMAFNGLQLAQADGRLSFAGSHSEAVDAAASGRIPVLDIMRVTSREQKAGCRSFVIPESWDVTSDSIAAWLAVAWHADLWLLKSVSPGTAPATHVDDWFAEASRTLPGLTWINLRDSEPVAVHLTLPLAAEAT